MALTFVTEPTAVLSRPERRGVVPERGGPKSSSANSAELETDLTLVFQFWYNQKGSHIFGALYLTVVWVSDSRVAISLTSLTPCTLLSQALVLALLPRPLSTWNMVQLYGLQPFFTIPLIPMTAFDLPRRWPWTWQCFMFCSIWLFAAANPIDMHLCGFYSAVPRCGSKDFQATLFFAGAAPCVALFALGMKRIMAVVFALSWVALMGATVINDRPRYVRNAIIGAFVRFSASMAHRLTTSS